MSETEEAENNSLEVAIAALNRDYGKLAARVRVLNKEVKCDYDGVTIRLHYPSFRQGSATVPELVNALAYYLTPFCLSRSETDAVDELFKSGNLEEFKIRFQELSDRAKELFKKAQKATNRNGEGGELLLYLLTEWVLNAPQLIAKMSLKTNPQMPVHGADGVHVRYDPTAAKLLLYWGEAKLHSDVGAAIKKTAESIAKSLQPDTLKHEINLVRRNISFAGLGDDAKEALLKYLDPYDESYNQRHDVITCLVGFDFDGFKQITQADGDTAETKFADLAAEKLNKLAPAISAAIKSSKLEHATIEMFFFPVPSVKELRDQFQDKIGWSN